MIIPPYLYGDRQTQSATLYGGSGLAISTLLPHFEHTLNTVNFLLHAFDGMARFGGAALIAFGWINHYLQWRKSRRSAQHTAKVILP